MNRNELKALIVAIFDALDAAAARRPLILFALNTAEALILSYLDSVPETELWSHLPEGNKKQL